MATAKPKVKRMMLGGAALGAVKKAASGAAKGMGSAGKPPATPPAGLNVAGIRKATAGLGDKFPRKAPPPAFPAKSGVGDAAAALRKLPMNPPMPGKAGPKPMQSVADAYRAENARINAQKSGSMGIGSQAASKTGLGNAIRGLGAASAGVGKALGMGKKKGGAVKKATKK